MDGFILITVGFLLSIILFLSYKLEQARKDRLIRLQGQFTDDDKEVRKAKSLELKETKKAKKL